MKQRFVFIVSLIVMVLTIGLVEANAQELVINGDTIAQVTGTNAEALIDKYVAQTGDAINSFLVSVQENFTDEAEFVWTTLVKHYKVGFFISLLFTAISILLLLFGVMLDKVYDFDWDDGVGFCMIVGAIMLIGSLIAVGCTLGKFLVPEYHAIKDLVYIIK